MSPGPPSLHLEHAEGIGQEGNLSLLVSAGPITTRLPHLHRDLLPQCLEGVQAERCAPERTVQRTALCFKLLPWAGFYENILGFS